jgi:hypothetical protein
MGFGGSSPLTARNSYRDFASGPFYGFNRAGAKVSEPVVDNWWRQVSSDTQFYGIGRQLIFAVSWQAVMGARTTRVCARPCRPWRGGQARASFSASSRSRRR